MSAPRWGWRRPAPRPPATGELLAAGLGAHRPVPAANAWPDDAVLLTYGELRRLVALHLDLARDQMPNTAPWQWVREQARAMRDGESPLLLSEILDQ